MLQQKVSKLKTVRLDTLSCFHAHKTGPNIIF